MTGKEGKMRPMYYNRDGTPCEDQDTLAWARDFEKERRVAKDTLPDGKVVSTVFLGLDHNFGTGLPLIFETMVFASDNSGDDLDVDRYSTEEAALKGHRDIVAKWKKRR